MKVTAVGILSTMALGLAAWAGTAIIKNKVEIQALHIYKTEMVNDIKEIKDDVKILIRRKDGK